LEELFHVAAFEKLAAARRAFRICFAVSVPNPVGCFLSRQRYVAVVDLKARLPDNGLRRQQTGEDLVVHAAAHNQGDT